MEKISPLFLFVPTVDTHYYWMRPIAGLLPNVDWMVFQHKPGNPQTLLAREKVEYHIYHPGLLRELRPATVIWQWIWAMEEQQVITEARLLGIPTVCIQEGALTFTRKGNDYMRYGMWCFYTGVRC